MIGRTLSHYKVLEKIGEGGMGEVYLAKDTKLDREVAVKVLPAAFSENKERLARFEREARLLASLNHPNIAAIHELEESDGVHFLALEYVPGETLAERIKRGPIPIDEALPLFKQIAEGLEAAHEKGVIHRDLKPSNIKVDTEGHVKVLDFGLAKAFADEVPESDLSQSPTLSRDATKVGVILGTAAYMSPEQARGKTVDKRTDIFSFGMVLYEMLTGKRAFTGEDVSDVLASIMKLEPDWKALPADVPPSLTKLLRRCLTKDRKKRLQAIGDARNEIEEILESPWTAAAPSEAAKVPLLWRALAAVAGVLFVALLATLWVLWQTVSAPEPTVRLSVNLRAGDSQLYMGIPGGAPALSPDGKMLAFVNQMPVSGIRQLYIRSLDNLEATPLSGTEGAWDPFFSPDGQWLAFFTGGVLKKVSVNGGAALPVAEAPQNWGGTWGPDDTIVYGRGRGVLYRVPASGGTPVELTSLEEGESVSHIWPSFLPNGKAVLFAVRPEGQSADDAIIEAVVLETGERKVLHRGGTYPRYASSGHLLYAREGTLFAIAFDADRVETTGEPSPVLESVLTYSNGNGVSFYAVSEDDSIVYGAGESSSVEEVARELVRVDREGNASLLTETLGDWETPRFSPDGQRVAVRKGVGPQEVWILELSRGTLQRLTFEEGLRPLWSPDGQTIFFGSSRAGQWNIHSKPADGSGPAEQLTSEVFRVPDSITSDGKTLVFRQGGDAGSPNLDVGILDLEGKGEPEMLLETSFSEHTPKLSPDDRWLAYVSDESGRDEIFVIRFPTGGKWQISTEGGKEPMWSRDGHELFYRNREKMIVVDVSEGADKAGKPVLLFEGAYDLKSASGATNYDVTPDGEGFVMIRTPETQESAGITQVTLVQNWFEELKRLVPTN